MKQHKNWQKEYKTIKGIPTTTRESVSSAVINLIEYCKKNNLDLGENIIDLGAGIGRNTIHLAQQGYKVTAVDFVQEALDKIIHKMHKLGLSSSITTVNASLGEKLPFKDNEFDSAIDIVSSISLNLDEMKVFESEVRRIIKPNALFLTYVHSRDDEYLAERSDDCGFHMVPESGLVEHSWTENELKEMYSKWNIIKLKKREKKDVFYDKKYTRRIWWLLVQNKKEQ